MTYILLFFVRENILTNQADGGHLAYYAHLVDLLATCAEVCLAFLFYINST